MILTFLYYYCIIGFIFGVIICLIKTYKDGEQPFSDYVIVIFSATFLWPLAMVVMLREYNRARRGL